MTISDILQCSCSVINRNTTAEGNKCRDPEPNIMQRVRDLEHSPKWDVSVRYLPSKLSKPHRREDRKNAGVGGLEDHKEQGPFSQHI